jgi:hypothetical protein
MSARTSLPLFTPDGRYVVVRGRLWRATNPHLTAERRSELVHALMQARRDVHRYRDDPEQLAGARARVQQAKEGLGERGPPWWGDATDACHRHMAIHTPYRDWFLSQTREEP